MTPTFKPVKCPPDCAHAMRMRDGVGGELVYHCGYILRAGESRGCDPGPGCNKYRPKKGKKPASIRVSKRKGPRSQWDMEKGRQMWKDGKTDQEIADALGVHRETVGKTRRRKWMKEGA